MGAVTERHQSQSYIEVAFRSELAKVQSERDRGMRNTTLNRALGTIYKIYYSPDQSLGQEGFDITQAMVQIKTAAINNGIVAREADKTEESALKYAATANWMPPNTGTSKSKGDWTPSPPRPVPSISVSKPKPVPEYLLNNKSITYFDYPRFNERKAGKKGGWQHLNEEGVWYTGRGSDEPVFYNEPENWDEWVGCNVVIVEGEKDVETLKSLQDPSDRKVLFLSGSFGANSPKMPFDLLPRDATIFFFYDADKAGREGARVAAERCATQREDLGVYHHADDGDQGIDATDVYEQGGKKAIAQWYMTHMKEATFKGVTAPAPPQQQKPITRPTRTMGTPTNKKPTKSAQERYSEVIENIAEDMIKAIEQGTAPWQKSWEPGQRITAHNLKTGKDYWGVNQLRLLAVGEAMGYPETRWATFRQIKEAGGKVKKGSKGCPVTGWFEVNVDQRIEAERQAEQAATDTGQIQSTVKKQFRAKTYPVFNISQTEGIPPIRVEAPSWDPCEMAEKVVQNSGVEIRHGGNRAYYNITEDFIQMPEMGQFPTQQDYYLVLMHELAHATGHRDRMNRETVASRSDLGKEGVAREELRAEISAMMTCTRLGLGHRPRHAATYVEGWCKVLKDTPHEIRTAATEAQKMSTFLLEGMGRNVKMDLQWREADPPDIEKHADAIAALAPTSKHQTIEIPSPSAEKPYAKGDEYYPDPLFNVTGVPPAIPIVDTDKNQKSTYSMER